MKEEPESVMESMFSSLLELASRSGAPIAINGNIESGAHIRALSYSCLLALAVAGESTGHLMRSTAALSHVSNILCRRTHFHAGSLCLQTQ